MVTLCAIWIIHFVQTINHIKHIDLWNTQAPLISFYQHSPDHEISPHYSANIKTFPGGFAHRPPRISFLFTFNFSPIYIPPINIHQISTHYSANFKKFPGGFASIPPHISLVLTFNFSPLYILLPTFTRPWDFSLLQRKYQKFSWGLRPQTPQHSSEHKISPHYSANIKKFPGAFAPRPPHIS